MEGTLPRLGTLKPPMRLTPSRGGATFGSKGLTTKSSEAGNFSRELDERMDSSPSKNPEVSMF